MSEAVLLETESADVRSDKQRDQNKESLQFPGNLILILHIKDKIMLIDEIWKTCLFFLFLLSGMVTTTVSLIITNENVPEDPSLPDPLLDQVTYWPAGVVVSETIMALAMITAFATVMMHRHRSIILRRVFFIVGMMYFYRAFTMSITVLPKPDQHWACPKQNTSLTMQGRDSNLKVTFL